MVYIGLFLISLLFLLVLICFLSTGIMIHTTRDEFVSSHSFQLGLIFNLIRIRLIYQENQKSLFFRIGGWNVLSKSLLEEKPEKVKEKSKKSKAKTKKTVKEKLRAFYSYKNLRIARLRNHFIGVIKSFKNPEIEGRVQLGLFNPMQTGILMGGYSFFSGIWSGFSRNIIFEPVFTDRTANWQISFSASFVPARLAWRGLLIWKMFRNIK